MMTDLRIDRIRMDGGTQPRALLDEGKIEEYAELMLDGVVFPDVVVVYDGTNYWLVDGFHRVNAAREAVMITISSEVLQGTLDDALWMSCSVNATHGVPRSNSDKRRAVELALKHQKGRNLTDVQLAKHCGVSSMTVGRYRGSIINNFNDNAVKTAIRDGKKYKMDTENIGKKKQPAPTTPGTVNAEVSVPTSEPVAPVVIAPSTAGAVRTFDESWALLSEFQRKALNGYPGSLSAARRLYELGQGAR